jgi:uncharacterized protein
MKKILIITDNKPGHESIPYGIVDYFKKYDDIEIVKLNIVLRFGLMKFLLKNLLKKKFFLNNLSLTCISIFYKFPNNINFSNIDLIISSGGNTSFINAMLSKLYKIPNVLCTYLRGLDNNLFDYILTVNPNDKHNNNLFFDLLPVRVSRDNDKISEFREKLFLKDKSIWSVLIGGATKEYSFDDEDIILIVEKIFKKAKKENKYILFTTSRRTGLKLENKLSNIIKEYDNVLYSVLYNIKEEKIMPLYLYNSDIVFVTEDSGAMITESIYAQKPTITIKGKHKNLCKKYKYYNYIENLINKNYIKSCSIDEIENIVIDGLNFEFYDISKNEVNFNKIYNLMKK